MFLRKGLLFFALLGLLICTGEEAAGSNAKAVLSLDLIADGGAGNQIDDGATSGTVSGQGAKIAVEVFATGVTTPLVGVKIEFDFKAEELKLDKVENSAFLYSISEPAGAAFAAGTALVTLSRSGFIGRAEFTTAVDVTGREFSIGIKRVVLAGGTNVRPVEEVITTTDVIRFNAAPSPDFNNDGIVDLSDYDLFRNQWNTRAGGPNWDAKFDLNVDGVIDLGDYAIFRDNWNKTFPVSPSDRDDDEEIVSIPDMNLRAVVEDSLNKASGAPISRDEMAILTRFAAVNANISDLTGLEFATNLIALLLVNNSISDLTPLSNLTNLQGLILDNNSISDLTPLSDLANLQGLWLQNNSISDLAPLVANTGLGSGDVVHVKDNPLSATSTDTHIPALQDRGVRVLFNFIDPTPVNIPDANLRAAIEDALDKSSGETITRGDMSNLTQLRGQNANISDVTGLEFAISLTSLSLHSNTISDVSPLSDLTHLTSLSLSSNSISDVSSLSGLTSLTYLTLHNNSISTVSALSELTRLRRLRLDSNSISDISGLSKLTSLTSLVLNSNTISDVSPLSGLTSLTSLILNNNTISDVSPLSDLTHLTYLVLNYNSIVNISPLSNLTNIETLWLRNNSITDLSPLVANIGWGSGDRVDVRYNPLSATSINTHIPALQERGVEVSFDPTPVNNDPTPVSIPDANLRAAIEAALGKSSGETITRGDMSILTRLGLNSQNISDLTGLEFATRLTDLSLQFHSVSDLSPLSGLTNLTRLYLGFGRNTISDFSPLAGLTNLTLLDLQGLSITDLSPLSGLTNLTTLWLFDNSISDLSLLSGLTNLRVLSLQNNSISDLAPLVANTGLGSGDRVDVRDNPLSDVSINTHIPALQERGVTVQF